MFFSCEYSNCYSEYLTLRSKETVSMKTPTTSCDIQFSKLDIHSVSQCPGTLLKRPVKIDGQLGLTILGQQRNLNPFAAFTKLRDCSNFSILVTIFFFQSFTVQCYLRSLSSNRTPKLSYFVEIFPPRLFYQAI